MTAKATTRQCDSPGSTMLLAGLGCAVLIWAPIIYKLWCVL